MIHFVIFSECIKVFTPYIRKHVLLTLDPAECLFLNAIIVLLLCGIVFLYKIGFDDHKMAMTMKRYKTLTTTQILFALFIGVATIISSMVVLTMDKNYNTPLINNMLFKIISVFLLLLTGVFFFREKYNYKQIIGITMIVIGGVLLFYHGDSFTIISKSNE